jgi:hypothetical protein
MLYRTRHANMGEKAMPITFATMLIASLISGVPLFFSRKTKSY